MFKCKECGEEYEIKPEYCDCGNDTFDEVTVEVKTSKSNYEKVKKSEEIISAKVFFKKPAKKDKPFFDPLSTIFFLGCVILAFIIIFFIGNPKEDITTEHIRITETAVKNIPNIDKFWDNTMQKSSKELVKKEVIEVSSPQKQEIKIASKPLKIQKNITKQVTKVKTPNKSMPVKTSVQKQNIQETTQSQKKQTSVVKEIATVNKPSVVTTNQLIQTVKTQSQIQPQQVQVAKNQNTNVVNKQELYNYKIGLRNKIANKINFANVIGDGSCVVTFSVSKSGTLINRKFKVQSSNFTLDDLVYEAVMQTPSYNPPPNGYNGEIMTLSVKIYHGNFEVSLN